MSRLRQRSEEVGSKIDSASFGMDPVTIATIVYYTIRIAILCWKEFDASGHADSHALFVEFARRHPRACRIRAARAARRTDHSLSFRQSFVVADELIREAMLSSKEEFEALYRESRDEMGSMDSFGDVHLADLGG